MRITPIDIQQQQFKSKMVGGYDQDAVDRFLEQVAEEIELLTMENQQLRNDLGRSQSALDEMRERESTLKETLITTQRMTDDLKANARRESELIVANAQMRAERILQETEEKRLQVLTEIQELRRQKISFETNLRAAIESHLRMLDIGVDVPPAASEPAPQRRTAVPTVAEKETNDPDSLF